MSTTYGRVLDAPYPLGTEDRQQGHIAFHLISWWSNWVKRRVETVEFVNETTIRRHVSVDFRIRHWIPDEGRLEHARGPVYYMPIALLKKAPLVRFDLRDESGRSIPLLTRRKNSAIAAGAMVAFAQWMVFVAVLDSATRPPRAWRGSGAESVRLRIPEEIETVLHRIAYLPFDGLPAHTSASTLLKDFLANSTPDTVRPLARWQWSMKGGWWTADATPMEWRFQLASMPGFRDMVGDFARLWMVTIPVEAAKGDRRVVKLTYDEPRRQPPTSMMQRFKRNRPSVVERAVNAVEDRLEGLRAESLNGPCEWLPPSTGGPDSTAPKSIGLPARLMQVLGLRSHVMHIAVGSVSHSGSYHLEIQAPNGTQIRRARLRVEVDGEEQQRHAERGARSLERVHLFVGSVPARGTGSAVVALKPRTTTVVRSAALTALLGLAFLVAAGLDLRTLTTHESHVIGPSAALLLLIPGLVTGLAARADEHPMTTFVLGGIRALAIVAAAGPIAGAALLVGARDLSWIGTAWWIIVAIQAAAWLLLTLDWRLAGRRRPDGTAP